MSALSVSNLLADTSYQVRVFARNSDGVVSGPSPSASGDTNETLTYTIDSANLSFSSLVPDTPVLSTTILRVYTNSSAGFRVSIQRANTGATLEHTTRANTFIADRSPWTGSGGASLWSGYGLGFRINQTNTDSALYSSGSWGSSDSIGNAFYAGVPGSYTNFLMTNVFSPSTRNIEIGWKVVTPPTQTSGTYQGAVSFRVYNDI